MDNLKKGHKRSGLLGNRAGAASPETTPTAQSAYVARMKSLALGAPTSTSKDQVSAAMGAAHPETSTERLGDDVQAGIGLEASGAMPIASHAPVSEQKVGQLVMLRVRSIKPSPYQPRVKLDPEHVAEIAESVRVDTLNDPITVRPYIRKEGGDENWEYELVSGENRLEGFKLLGEEFIPAIIKLYDDFQAARVAVFSNKKRKDYAPYEEFRGYWMLLDMGAVKSQNQMAIDAEMSKAEMSRLMSFAKLPQAAHDILKQTPHLIGSNVASALVGFAEREDYSELVVAALGKIAAGELDQMKAAYWIEQQIKPKSEKPSKPANERRSVTYHGGRTFATIKRDDHGFKIDLDKTLALDQEEFERALLEFLTAHAMALPE